MDSGALHPCQPFFSCRVIDWEVGGSTSALARPVTLRSPATSRKFAGLGGGESISVAGAYLRSRCRMFLAWRTEVHLRTSLQ